MYRDNYGDCMYNWEKKSKVIANLSLTFHIENWIILEEIRHYVVTTSDTFKKECNINQNCHKPESSSPLSLRLMDKG